MGRLRAERGVSVFGVEEGEGEAKWFGRVLLEPGRAVGSWWCKLRWQEQRIVLGDAEQTSHSAPTSFGDGQRLALGAQLGSMTTALVSLNSSLPSQSPVMR